MHCFLCEIKLNKKIRTNEHIIPAWLLEKHGYKNDPNTGEVNGVIILPNGKKQKYDKLKIPCCAKCNNEILKAIEDQIKIAVESGYDDFCFQKVFSKLTAETSPICYKYFIRGHW